MLIYNVIILIFLYLVLPFNIYAGQYLTGKIETPSLENQHVQFLYYYPEKLNNSGFDVNILVCVGALNSLGIEFMASPWTDFADKNGIILLAPGFQHNQNDWEKQESYQYPDVWSGDVLIKMLCIASPDTNVKNFNLYIFGFSAGAQFVQRFALLWPEITKAVYIHAAEGYTFPETKIDTQFIISIGEKDTERLSSAKNFHQVCLGTGIKCNLKIFPGLGHEITPVQFNTALTFFKSIMINSTHY
ncbi:hypothetical protein HY745_09860 [Candidatus Desantisbacteria bacterium]|nr:hypothetical protein [Candidatus Desantisbacteria bacterium]